ncbi:hypothetical protein HHK36_008382 [Tetracentron sinense]|uniref:RING-type E3 ubiquitin transferase n=1 Tax=Tetracentron sinense TaxID=13715 RepID=A0A834ZQ24_TETSI|nr:hypothetical protein HHK36_008382 [Tetracentron sinense]
MEWQRTTIDSFPETLDFDHGSSSSNTGMDQQIPWTNMQNPVERQLPDYILTPTETNITYGNIVSHDGRSLSGWNFGEPNSNETMGNRANDDIEMEHGWLSSLSVGAGASPRLEEIRYEPTNILSLENINISLSSNQFSNGPLSLQNSNSDGMPQNVNLNAGYVGNNGNGGQVTRACMCPHQFKSGGSETEQIPYTSGSSDSFGIASGSAGCLTEDNDGGPGCSSGNWRFSCKRKAFEGASGQSSLGGSSSCFQQIGNSVWPAVPHYNAASGLIIPTSRENPHDTSPLEQLNPRLGVGMRGVASDNILSLNVAGNAESSQRNFRMRINPAEQQNSVPPNTLSTGSAIRQSHIWSPHQSSRLLPNYSLDSRSRAATTNTNPQNQSNSMHIPTLSRNVQHFPWDGTSNLIAGSSSSSPVISGERGAVFQEEAHSRSMRRYISERSMFLPATEMRNLAQDPTSWSLANGNISIPGNIASTSRAGSSSGVHPSPTPTWVPHHNPPAQNPQNPRRLPEFIRQSLFPSAGSESGNQSSNFSLLHSGPGPASSQEMALSSGIGRQGHHQPYMRSAFGMERQGNGVFGVPYSLRTPAAATEGRSRLLSEIRNVLDLMHRGESMGFEDVIILDRSVFNGVTDLHDRHRDMRLDVDNMSYEELLALEERIGNVNTGLSEETVLKCLKQQKYLSLKMGAPSEVEPCCICQEEYVDGQDLGTLDCGHDFHTGCIKQWLTHKNLCPICKTTALVT